MTGKAMQANVTVYDSITERFVPVAGATVKFGKETSQQTDENGSVKFNPEQAGTIKVVAELSGYTRSNSEALTIVKAKQNRELMTADERQAMAESAWIYLVQQQDANGLVGGSQGVTEWSAVALGSFQSANRNESIQAAILAYEPTVDDGTTELARHILALAAQDINPRSANGIDYISRLKETEHNNQFGSVDYINDDIFAGLALIAANEPWDSKYLTYAVNAAKSGINDDKGVSYMVAGKTSDVDTTAYFVQFLRQVNVYQNDLGVKTTKAQRQALQYLRAQQNVDGGWGYADHGVTNSSSTAVALQALGNKATITFRNKRNGYNVLADLQQETGAFAYNTSGSQSVEELNTAYAIPALLQ
jgi:prenyltransferase beta subunit